MKTRTAPWDYARLILPPTKAECEAEKVATCPVCGGKAFPMAGGYVYCDEHGIKPTVSSRDETDPRSAEERDLDELAADEAATINFVRPGL